MVLRLVYHSSLNHFHQYTASDQSQISGLAKTFDIEEVGIRKNIKPASYGMISPQIC